jgi:hypothetical protein
MKINLEEIVVQKIKLAANTSVPEPFGRKLIGPFALILSI